jgi:hypothetical protein
MVVREKIIPYPIDAGITAIIPLGNLYGKFRGAREIKLPSRVLDIAINIITARFRGKHI